MLAVVADSTASEFDMEENIMKKYNKHRTKSLHQQVHDKFQSMLAIGRSKHDDKAAGVIQNKIYSWSTYRCYRRHALYFIAYIRAAHPECRKLEECRKYVREWLMLQETQVKSAWTVHTEAKALGKLFGITPKDPDYYKPPKRNRSNIKRSRPGNGAHANFSEKNNNCLVRFCSGTGLREHELLLTRPEHLYTREKIFEEIARIRLIPAADRSRNERRYLNALLDIEYFPKEEFFVFVPKGKGGRMRIAPIVGDVEMIVSMYHNAEPGTKLWHHVHTEANIHGYRAEYAAALYRSYARPIDEIPYDKVNKGSGHAYQSQVYVCRNDMKGVKLDREAMMVASKALGHNRIGVIATSYLWTL